MIDLCQYQQLLIVKMKPAVNNLSGKNRLYNYWRKEIALIKLLCVESFANALMRLMKKMYLLFSWMKQCCLFFHWNNTRRAEQEFMAEVRTSTYSTALKNKVSGTFLLHTSIPLLYRHCLAQGWTRADLWPFWVPRIQGLLLHQFNLTLCIRNMQYAHEW